MSNPINVDITSTEDVTDTLQNIQSEAVRTERVIVSSMGTSEQAFDTAARESGTLGKALDALSGAGSQLASGMDGLAGAFDSVVQFQNAGAQQADNYERKLIDVEQAMLDTDQAAGDLKQAQLDLNQAQVDAKQAGADAEQAQLDVKQALIDAKTAQQDYNAAVKEHGPNSLEAKQAAQDLAQAQQDLKQANIDAEQAEVDLAQAHEDTAQAGRDLEQSAVDARTAQVDLNEAQRAAEPPTTFQEWGMAMQTITPIIMGVVGAVDLLILANTVLTSAFVKQTAANIASKIAMVATTAALGIVTAAQWAWNIAMNANPIMLIITAIGLLVGAIIWIATKTTWFSDLWEAIWSVIGEPVKAAWEWIQRTAQNVFNALSNGVTWVKNKIVGGFRSAIDTVVAAFKWILDIPNKIGQAFSWLGDKISAPFKAAFNFIARLWNNTVGRINFTIPSWVPVIGGSSFGFPRIPELQRGGEITRTGAVLAHKGERIMPAGTRGLWNDNGGVGGVLEIRLVGGPEEFRRWIQRNTRLYGGRGPNNVQLAWGSES